MHLVILNGAKGSGKDTLGAYLIERLAEQGISVIWGRIKDVMYKATAKRYNLPDYDHWVELCNDPELKEEPLAILGGKSPREVLIYESEEVIKVIKGETGVVEEYFDFLVQEYGEHKLRNSIIVFTDGGFQSETDWLMYVGFPDSKPIIVRLGRTGHNFKGDSRQYLKAPKYIFSNAYGKEHLETIADIIVSDIITEEGIMTKQFVEPPATFKKKFRAALLTAAMLKEGEIKFYEVGLAYRCNLRAEVRRKW